MENLFIAHISKPGKEGGGMITVIKEKITVNQDIQNSREVC